MVRRSECDKRNAKLGPNKTDQDDLVNPSSRVPEG
jgi:hypothetical protein